MSQFWSPRYQALWKIRSAGPPNRFRIPRSWRLDWHRRASGTPTPCTRPQSLLQRRAPSRARARRRRPRAAAPPVAHKDRAAGPPFCESLTQPCSPPPSARNKKGRSQTPASGYLLAKRSHKNARGRSLRPPGAPPSLPHGRHTRLCRCDVSTALHYPGVGHPGFDGF